MDKSRLIALLEGTQPREQKLADHQTADDIMQGLLEKHERCRRDYDLICDIFEVGSVWQICRNLYDECRSSFIYKEEPGRRQNVSCPYTILSRTRIDCKNYALFIGGVLDALKRKGYSIRWLYRFACYDPADLDIGHVFVVVNPDDQDIWVDPVISTFNKHAFYLFSIDERPRASRPAMVGRVPARVGTTDAENKLLAQLLDYQQGLVGAVGATTGSGQFNQVSSGVLKGVATTAANLVIPGGGALVALASAGELALAGAFPPGSAGSRLLTDLANFNVVGLWNDIWGRTWNTDQYWGAVYYKFYVLGENVTDEKQVSDGDVIPALKWFIDRTGVFISGREHIIALTQSPTAYMNYHSVNADTTTDSTLVQAAYLVASKYWKNPGNFNPSLMGSWAGTIGVFDTGLLQAAAAQGLTPEQYAHQTGTTELAAQKEIQQASPQASIIPGIPNVVTYGAAAALVFFGLKN